MNALTFQQIGQIAYEHVPDPEIISGTDVIVKVQKTAICGSDMHVYHGREQGLDRGTVMGHEFVGEVVEIGKDIRLLAKGDVVVSPFTTNCGHCYYCRIGLTCRCSSGQLYGWVANGHGLHGAQAEYVRVPLADSSLVTYPEDIPAELALLTGDILSTGYYCADRAEVQKKGIYVVVGCGPVGIMTVLGASQQGAEVLYAIDAIPERLQQAKRFGAIPINYQTEDAVKIILQATKDRGADAVMEAVGSPAAARLAFDLVRPGGTVSSVGVHTSPNFAFSPVEAYDKNITFRIGRCPARHYMEKLIPMVREKKEELQSVISHQIPLSSGPDAYRLFDRKEEGCMKVILEVG